MAKQKLCLGDYVVRTQEQVVIMVYTGPNYQWIPHKWVEQGNLGCGPPHLSQM